MLQPGDQSREVIHARLWSCGEQRPQTPDGTPETVCIHRLEQVIDCSKLEGPEREFIVGGDEYEQWRNGTRLQVIGKFGRHLQSAQSRHPDVEKGHVGPLGFDQSQRFDSIGRDTRNLQLRPGERQCSPETACEQRFVFGDYGTWGHVRSLRSVQINAAMGIAG